TTYSEGATFNISAEDLTLYAIWEAIDYTIAYDANGGSGDVPVDASNYNVGDEVTVLGQGTLAFAGYAFAGWNTAADGTGTAYLEGAAFTMPAEDVTFYAIWEVIPTYTVTFTVVDEVSAAVENASISIDGNELTTDGSGVATVDLINGSYDYTITKAGYDEYTGSVTVTDSDEPVNITLIETRNTVTFVVSQGGVFVENATITIHGQELTTNEAGEAYIDLSDGTYQYVVSIEGQSEYIDDVVVNGEDITVYIDAPEPTYTVSFTILDENSVAIEGAEVTVDDAQLITDADGLASVNLQNGIYDVVVTKDGYQSYNESITVGGEDLSVEIRLNGMESVPFGYSLYPNPVQTELQVAVDAVSIIEIYNVSGKRMLETQVIEQKTIDVSTFPKGVYVVRLTSGKQNITEQLIVE
nr:carboxypeptidase regulatory-like domain-containing protein [Salinivirgaceae bacterium]